MVFFSYIIEKFQYNKALGFKGSEMCVFACFWYTQRRMISFNWVGMADSWETGRGYNRRFNSSGDQSISLWFNEARKKIMCILWKLIAIHLFILFY